MDRLQLMLEADRRGILPPEQKALLDEAVRRGLVAGAKPASVSAGETIRSIPRQIGLTARYGLEGLADVAGIATEPIRAVVNPLLDAVGLPKAQSTRALATGLADVVGLPSPETPDERVVGDASRLVAGAGGLGAAARKLAGAVTGPVAKKVLTTLGENMGLQTVSAAGAGGAGGAVREAGGGPGEQFAASVVGGLGAAGATALAQKAYTGITQAMGSLLRPKASITEVNVVLNEILKQNGMDVGKVPAAVRADLAREVKRALDTGGQVNPDVVRRLADYGAVGATPTRGTVTLDPAQITQERNLAKIGMNSQDPRLQQLGRVQNENNAVLIRNLNELGGGTTAARDPVGTGALATGAIKSRDAAARSVEKALYEKARDSSGRSLNLDSEGFVADAYNRLAQENKGAFLPDSIKAVLEQLRSGKVMMGGKEYPAPFTVDTIDSLKTMLATAQRSSGDGNVRRAIALVRSSLDDVSPVVQGRNTGSTLPVNPAQLAAAQGKANDTSASALKAFDAARRFARARRSWQESSPGIAAALDDAAPDTFVQKYILSPSDNASTAEVERLLFTLKKDPQATQAVKENIIGYFKSKALSGNADEVANFSPSAYNAALKAFGDRKLKLFFKPDEIAQLKAIGRVASYETFQPRGSAVNNSNTASAVAGLLDRIASNRLLSRLPFGETAIQGPAKQWSAQIGAKSALDPSSQILKMPERTSMRIQDLLGPGFLLAAPRADGRNNEKRD